MGGKRYPDTRALNIMRDSRTVQLPDGRILGYAEYGAETGYPLLFVHGFPASRLDGCVLDKIARRRKIRVIAPDRPGYGLSTYHDSLRIVHWPDDVRSLVQHLGIKQFAMLGYSGGGPSTVACACTFPKDMLTAVGLLATSGPWEAGTQGVPLMPRVAKSAATYCPAIFVGVTNMLAATLRYTQNTRLANIILDKVIAKDKTLKSRSDFSTNEPIREKRARIMRILLEPFAQGAKGFVQDARLIFNPWGFNLEDVEYNKIQIWHPTKDVNAPLWMARYVADRLPHSVFKEFEDDDHYSVVRHFDAVLSDLLSDVAQWENYEDAAEDSLDISAC